MRKTEYITKIFETISGNYVVVFDDGHISFGFFLTSNYCYQSLSNKQRTLSASICRQIESKFPYWKKLTPSDVEWLMITSDRGMEDLVSNLYLTVLDRKDEVVSVKKPIQNVEPTFSIISRMRLAY